MKNDAHSAAARIASDFQEAPQVLRAFENDNRPRLERWLANAFDVSIVFLFSGCGVLAFVAAREVFIHGFH